MRVGIEVSDVMEKRKLMFDSEGSKQAMENHISLSVSLH
jgi:hypothetical protein